MASNAAGGTGSPVRAGDAANADLALRILLQMDPENRHRKRLEKQVKGMKG